MGSAAHEKNETFCLEMNLPSLENIKSKTEIRRLIKALSSYEPDRVYLFGSHARGEEDELSDLDIIIIKSTFRPFLERLWEVGKLLPSDMGAVDILVYTPEEFDHMQKDGNVFARMIHEEGLLIYERSTKSGS